MRHWCLRHLAVVRGRLLLGRVERAAVHRPRQVRALTRVPGAVRAGTQNPTSVTKLQGFIRLKIPMAFRVSSVL